MRGPPKLIVWVKTSWLVTYPLMLPRGVNVGVRSVSILREYLSRVYVSYMTDVSFMANVCAGLWMALMAASRFSQMHIARHSRRSFSVPYQYCDHKQMRKTLIRAEPIQMLEPHHSSKPSQNNINLKSLHEHGRLATRTYSYSSTSTWVPHSCLL